MRRPAAHPLLCYRRAPTAPTAAHAPSIRRHHVLEDGQRPARGPGNVSNERLHELDAMRSVLMLLGIVLHAANPYRSSGNWLVADSARLGMFDAIDYIIHLFRMPAFFVVAGYFAMLLLRRRPWPTFLRDRLLRTLLPTVSVLLTFNLAQAWLLGRPSPSAEAFLRDDVLPAWWTGTLLGHLWFLVYLAAYCVILAVLRPWLLRFAASRWPERLSRRGPFLGVLALASLTPVAGVALAYAIPRLWYPVWGLFDPVELISYAAYFLIGCGLQTQSALLQRFSRPGIWTLLVALVAAFALWLPDAPPKDGDMAVAGALLATSILSWCLVRVVFFAFRHLAGRPSRAFRYLSGASYSMYLFHHLFVIAIAIALLPLPWPAFAKFLVVLVGAALPSLALHHFLVRPFAPMRLIFNGVLPTR